MSTKSPPAGRGAVADPLEAGLSFRLGRAHRTVRGAWRARIADLGLSSAQASTLRAVVERPASGVRELARTLGTDPMNAKRLADSLETVGLVRSSADPADRRIRVLSPTDAGCDLAREVERRSRAWEATLARLLEPDDMAAVLRTLDRLEAGIATLAASSATGGPGAADA
jgi:DNA-binding MarR family transcriptional regulator